MSAENYTSDALILMPEYKKGILLIAIYACSGKEIQQLHAQLPASTEIKKSSTNRLKIAGSSRLTACLDWGKTTNPDLGILRFIKRAGSMQGASSSPTMTSVGTVSC